MAKGVIKAYQKMKLGTVIQIHSDKILYEIGSKLDRFYIYGSNTHPVTFKQVNDFMREYEKEGELVYNGVRMTKGNLLIVNVKEWVFEGEKVLKEQNVVEQISVFVSEHVKDNSEYFQPKL